MSFCNDDSTWQPLVDDIELRSTLQVLTSDTECKRWQNDKDSYY